MRAAWTYTGATRARDKFGLAWVQRYPKRMVIARGWRKTLDRYAESQLA